MVETRRRATATAVMFLFLNLIALGGGPLFTGWMIDHFAQFHFSHPGAAWPSGPRCRRMFGGRRTGVNFAPACPGRQRASHAVRPAAQVIHCSRAEVGATRQGILVTIGFYAWGAFHYLLATFGWPPAGRPTRRAPPANSSLPSASRSGYERRMIPRYARPEAAAIWSPQTRFRIMFEIEAHAADAMAELGVIPKAAAAAIWERGGDGGLRRRPHRRDRARDQARRHRLPDPRHRDRRARGAVPAPGHDLVGRQRHGPGGAARPGHRPADRGRRPGAGGAEAPGLRAPADARPSAAATASTPSRPPSA